MFLAVTLFATIVIHGPPNDAAEHQTASDSIEVAAHPLGSTVGSTGLVIFGPWGFRKAYVPLDGLIVPKHFLGAWAPAEDGCDMSPVPTVGEEKTESRKLVLTATHLIGREGKRPFLRSYIEVERRVSTAMIGKRKPIALPARQFAQSKTITLMLAQPGSGETTFLTLRASSEPMTIEYSENGHKFRKLVQCYLGAGETTQM